MSLGIEYRYIIHLKIYIDTQKSLWYPKENAPHIGGGDPHIMKKKGNFIPALAG